jgi:hypothetical protein
VRARPRVPALVRVRIGVADQIKKILGTGARSRKRILRPCSPAQPPAHYLAAALLVRARPRVPVRAACVLVLLTRSRKFWAPGPALVSRRASEAVLLVVLCRDLLLGLDVQRVSWR